MGFNRKRNWLLLRLCVIMVFSCSVLAGNNGESIDGFLRRYVNRFFSKSNPRTGVLYNNISLPANLSGIQISYIRLRSGSFWGRGANLSSVLIPPRVLPNPYVKRIAIVYENLGNWSSYYYQLPGYTLVAPVIGFTVYDSSSNSTASMLSLTRKLHLEIMGDLPIYVMFPKLMLDDEMNVIPQCVQFEAGGSYVLKNMTTSSSSSSLMICTATDYGHFSLVIPTTTQQKIKKMREKWEWWVVGFGAGLIVLAFLGLVLGFILRLVKMKNIRKMEWESERGVTLDTKWIGKSKIPCASMIRTQPNLENNYNAP